MRFSSSRKRKPNLISLWLACKLVSGVSAIAGQVEKPDATLPSAGKPLSIVLDVERPKEEDILRLQNGDQVAGTILNETFVLRTSYAELKFDRRRIAGIDLRGDGKHVESIITVNNNRFSGFLTDPSFDVRLATGAQVAVRREKVRVAIFSVRQAELEGLSRHQFVVLRNGDFFSGKVLNNPELVVADFGKTLVPLSDLESVSFVAGKSPSTRLRWRTGDVRQGKLETEDIDIQLDAGPRIRIFQDRIDVIYCRDGFIPENLSSPDSRLATPQSAVAPAGAPHKDPEGMVWIPPGKFVMGSPREELERGLDEGPVIEATIQHGFWMGKCEVTQAEYLAMMGNNPSHYTGDTSRPVEKVSWQDALEYCSKRTTREREAGRLPTGYSFRLPTEAEWEYACRAGTTTRFSYGDDPVYSGLEAYAWFLGNSRSATHPVGTKLPNPWGLYDMHGNVWEWCLDYWSGAGSSEELNNRRVRQSSLRGARGGSWLYEGRFCRSANRDDYFPSNRCSDLGFRVVLALLQP